MSSKSTKVRVAAIKPERVVGSVKVGFATFCQRKSDIDIIRERLSAVMADEKLYKETLVKSGVYDSNLKLAKAYR